MVKYTNVPSDVCVDVFENRITGGGSSAWASMEANRRPRQPMKTRNGARMMVRIKGGDMGTSLGVSRRVLRDDALTEKRKDGPGTAGGCGDFDGQRDGGTG